MDFDLLQALTATLCLLGEARCRAEGEVALTTAVIRDLRRVSRRLRSVQHGQSPEPTQQVPAPQQPLHHYPAVPQLMQQGLPKSSLIEAAVNNAVLRDSRPVQPAGRTTPAATVAAVNRPAAARTTGAKLSSGAARNKTQATPQPVVSRASCSSSRGRASTSSATRQATGLPRSYAVPNTVTQATAAAAAVAQAPVIPAPASLPPEQQQDDSVALTELPNSFVQLLQQYRSLQIQLKELAHPDQQQHADITSSASAGFMASLQKAYGRSAVQRPQQQQQSRSILKQLSLYDFSNEAEYVGLVSAVLWAVQASNKKNSSFCSSTDDLQPIIACMMQQCQHWLNRHAAQQQLQQQCSPTVSPQQQLTSPDLRSLTAPQIGDVVRWRNRCLRSILSTAKSFETGQSAATGAVGASVASSADQQSAAAVQAGLWLPNDCWKPMMQATAGSNNVSCNTSGSAQVQTLQQMLLPGWRAQLQQHERVGGQVVDAAGPRRLPMLYYADVQDLIQHCRHLQKLQQLLLHQHIEAELAPRLLQCLVDGCKQLSQPDSKTNEQRCQGWNVERGLALYRLLYALTAAPAKRRGLGGGCHVVEQQILDDVATLQWL